ncbi:MAG TPA: hypothetical protein VJH03_07340 [Blastocatellia bacterium]|nr:hypothetical protein [Blastocatellia bacterium]
MTATLGGVGLMTSRPTVVQAQREDPRKKLDPAAWGANHVGKPIPEYVHGDECLFCHRNDIGPTWQRNSHGLTVRQREDATELSALLKSQASLAPIAPQVEYFLGSRHRVRFMKKAGYGRFDLLNTQLVLGATGKSATLVDAEKPAWDKDRFGNRCAGCHATAVDSATKTFSAFGLDCFTCHGDVNLNHTGDTSLVLLSKKRRRESRVITSICAQCHLRNAASRSSGLPYANNFVAGDNLFQDYEVDFSKADDESLNPGDRHVLRNVRDVVLYGEGSPTCITCHQVHAGSTARHRMPPRSPVCFDCHVNTDGPVKAVKPYTVHSSLCEY